jgi:hypothetical protein
MIHRHAMTRGPERELMIYRHAMTGGRSGRE